MFIKIISNGDLMKKYPQWYFNEKQIGIDYLDSEVAGDYNNQHQTFRDFKREAEHIAHILNIGPQDTIIDFGCGTGGIALNLAKYCKKVICVDISNSMLEILKANAEKENINNIETCCAGFLSYKHNGDPVDKIITSFAMHHLPDFWKSIALLQMAETLKKEGKLYLVDVVFTFEVGDYKKNIENFVANMQKEAGDFMADEAIVHIRDEFSSYDWIIEGLFKNTGFSIDSKNIEADNLVSYICTKL